MHFLIDMNMPRGWVDVVSRFGHRATYWRDVGPATARDEEIMSFARSNRLVVLTRDLDFGELLALNGGKGPSVVQLRDGDTTPFESAARVMEAIERFSAQITAGALVTVAVKKSKVRALPIVESRP